MAQRIVPLGVHNETVEVGSHIAYFWETDHEFDEGVGFLSSGLGAGDFCVIFGHEEANAKVRARLTTLGYDCARLESDNKLLTLPGHQNAEQMLGHIGESFSKAIASGTTLIRLLGNIGWGHDTWPSERDILEFEAKVTAAAKQYPCVVVCMYDVRTLSGRVIVHGAFETHPLTICGNMLRENPHYLEFDEFIKRLGPETKA